MPALLAPLLAVSLGVLLAWFTEETPGERAADTPGLVPLLLTSALAVLVYGPLVASSLALAPDWSLGYLVPPGTLPRGTDHLIVLISILSLVGAFVLAHRWSRQATSPRWVTVAAGLPAVTALMIVAVGIRRWTALGTYAQYHDDFAVLPLAGSPVGWVFVVQLTATGLAFWWTARALGRHSRRAR